MLKGDEDSARDLKLINSYYDGDNLFGSMRNIN